jgi:hypothetical protein
LIALPIFGGGYELQSSSLHSFLKPFFQMRIMNFSHCCIFPHYFCSCHPTITHLTKFIVKSFSLPPHPCDGTLTHHAQCCRINYCSNFNQNLGSQRLIL